MRRRREAASGGGGCCCCGGNGVTVHILFLGLKGVFFLRFFGTFSLPNACVRGAAGKVVSQIVFLGVLFPSKC